MADEKLDLIVNLLRDVLTQQQNVAPGVPLPTKHNNNNNSLDDAVVKVIVGMASVGIVGLFGFCFMISSKITELNVHLMNIQEDMIAAQRKLESPRHTREDAIEILVPITDRLSIIEAKQANRADRFARLERDTDNLHSSITGITTAIEGLKDTSIKNRDNINKLMYELRIQK